MRVWRMLVLEAWFRIPPCVKGPRRKGGRAGTVPGLLSRISASGPWIGCKAPPGVREGKDLPPPERRSEWPWVACMANVSS